jgi:hypothetical protein
MPMIGHLILRQFRDRYFTCDLNGKKILTMVLSGNRKILLGS